MPETRVTAGEFRGRTIFTPSGLQVRPTQNVVRQALFNILGTAVRGAAVLDLYAGAGTVGFEALSRGAAHVTFVEKHRPTCLLIRRSAEKLGCLDRIRVVTLDVPRWLRGQPAEVPAADLCFLDPPYQDPSLDEAVRLLGEHPPHTVVCEHHRARRLPEDLGALEIVREARYGLTRLTILRRGGSE